MTTAASFSSYLLIYMNKYLSGTIYINYYLDGIAIVLSYTIGAPIYKLFLSRNAFIISYCITLIGAFGIYLYEAGWLEPPKG
jgi:hypothetical protein